jgi:GT2 family glycosyltransferase
MSSHLGKSPALHHTTAPSRATLRRHAALEALTAVDLDSAFWQPSRIGVMSAWWAHVPFAHWLVAAVRPSTVVELGTHNGVSFSAFCEAMQRGNVVGRCYAIDTWNGDKHPGTCDESVFQNLSSFIRSRYGDFAELLRLTFDEALPRFDNGSVDLLHIDGVLTYEAVKSDFEKWRRKLSERGIVLFHDTNVRQEDFGVCKFWSELRDQCPSFEFLHGHGLGIAAIGSNLPASIVELCGLEPEVANLLRERFAQLGERWALADSTERAGRQVRNLELQVRNLERHARNLLQAEREAIYRSTSWRITAPLRWLRTAGQAGRRDLISKVQHALRPFVPARISAWARSWRDTQRRAYHKSAYHKWIRQFDVVTAEIRRAMAAEIARWPSRPLISVIMPSYDIDPKWMSQAIDSVRNQIYPHWELCISDDASTIAGIRALLEQYAARDPRIRVTFRTENGHISVNSNTALDLASGDYIALLDADDLLSEDALFWVGREIAIHPDVDLIFSDEDKLDEQGRRFDPYFKQAWNPALMLSQNAFSHLGVYRRSLVEAIGRFRQGYEGSQDYDLVLRCAARTTPDRIRHIPLVLYHWRALPKSTAAAISAKTYAWEAGRRAIADYLRGQRINARVEPALGTFYRLEYDVPRPLPLVSIIVPTTLSGAIPLKCIRSVLSKSRYENFELLILAQTTNLRAARTDQDFISLCSNPRVRVVEYDETPFNFSSVNNLGVRSSRGQLLCFLNDDVEVITEDWLEQLVARVSLEGVGAAGVMLYYPSNCIQHAGVILGIGGVAGPAFNNRPRGYAGPFGRAALEQDYSCVTAACLLVRRAVFDHAGGFDESLPAAFNDVDLCIKIRQQGSRIIWTPHAEMYHYESLTFGHPSSTARRVQFKLDVQLIRTRWHDVLDSDPCYNPNFDTMPGAVFSFAQPPRLPAPMNVVTAVELISISRTSQLTSGRV